MITLDRLDAALEALPILFDGPGGAAAVLHEGRVIGRRAWGWADIAHAISFTDTTLFPICSITKQFTCALLLDRFPDPSVLDGVISERLGKLRAAPPTTRQLCHNQSGLRDYWAAAMLCGALPDSAFDNEDACALIERTATLQFAPGTRYSYANQNFRMLSDAIDRRSDNPFSELLQRHIFAPAGMSQAVLGANTAAPPGGIIGYEGTPASGFISVVNRIVWTGDAGICASLSDMMAWERHIDATRDDPTSLYARMSAPVTFSDGSIAGYGFGLARGTELGLQGTGHGGALRGFRSYRFHIPAHRVSVVVLFNHYADPAAAVRHLLASLDLPRTVLPTKRAFAAPDEHWSGTFVDSETGLAARLAPLGDGRVELQYGTTPDILDIVDADTAAAPKLRLHRSGDGYVMERALDHQSSRLVPGETGIRRDVEGVFTSREYDARFVCLPSGGMLYGRFEGFLGNGEVHPMLPLGIDLWRLPCRRAVDHFAPGEWTVRFERDPNGRVSGARIGCWLARDIAFECAKD